MGKAGGRSKRTAAIADAVSPLRLLRYAETFEKTLTTKLDKGGALAARYTHGEGLRAKFFSTALQARDHS